MSAEELITQPYETEDTTRDGDGINPFGNRKDGTAGTTSMSLGLQGYRTERDISL